jgi:putative ABC transport system permease protein
MLREGLKVTLIGVAAGLVLATLASRALASFLFEISSLDPLVFISCALLLALVTILANYIPARRAAGLDPMVAFRYE